jgi:hypothetical protein
MTASSAQLGFRTCATRTPSTSSKHSTSTVSTLCRRQSLSRLWSLSDVNTCLEAVALAPSTSLLALRVLGADESVHVHKRNKVFWEAFARLGHILPDPLHASEAMCAFTVLQRSAVWQHSHRSTNKPAVLEPCAAMSGFFCIQLDTQATPTLVLQGPTTCWPRLQQTARSASLTHIIMHVLIKAQAPWGTAHRREMLASRICTAAKRLPSRDRGPARFDSDIFSTLGDVEINKAVHRLHVRGALFPCRLKRRFSLLGDKEPLTIHERC